MIACQKTSFPNQANSGSLVRRINKPRAFTLVELLVVIAVISVLAGLLLPALEEAVVTARQVKCANRLRQTMQLVAMYHDDYRVVMPSSMGYNFFLYSDLWIGQQLLYEANLLDRDEIFGPTLWGGLNETAVAPIRERSIMLCPSGIMPDDVMSQRWKSSVCSEEEWDYQDGWTRWNSSGGNPAWYTKGGSAVGAWSYGINSNMTNIVADTDKGETLPDPSRIKRYYRPIKNVDSPSNTLYMMEAWTSSINALMWFEVDCDDRVGMDYRHIRIPHGGRTNYACYDGHVGSITRDLIGLFQFGYGNATAQAYAESQLPFQY